MKKSDEKLLAPLILTGMVVYPFIWLHDKIGWAGIIFLAVLIAVGIWYRHARSRKQDEDDFNGLVLYVLNNRLPPNEARKLNQNLFKTNFPRSALIRSLQILRDSIEISLASKKREIAEFRLAEVESSYAEIRREHANLITAETMAEIDRVVNECIKAFYTRLYENIALAHIEKAKKLKTVKSKEKYAALAMEAINEGLENPRSEKYALLRAKKSVEYFTEALADGS